MREVIERLEALLEKATPGRLHAADVDGCWCVAREPGTPGGSGFAVDGECWKQEDAALIAEAINALPTLLRLARAVEDAPEVVVEVMDERTHGYQCNAVNADALEVGASARLVVIPDKD